jgi:hypothetical protein
MLGPGWLQRQVWLRRRFFVRLKGPFLRLGQPHAKHRAQAAVNDRASDRDAAPKASLTVASTVLLKTGPLEARGEELALMRTSTAVCRTSCSYIGRDHTVVQGPWHSSGYSGDARGCVRVAEPSQAHPSLPGASGSKLDPRPTHGTHCFRTAVQPHSFELHSSPRPSSHANHVSRSTLFDGTASELFEALPTSASGKL